MKPFMKLAAGPCSPNEIGNSLVEQTFWVPQDLAFPEPYILT